MRGLFRTLSWMWCFGVGWLLGYLAAVNPKDTASATILAAAFWCIACGIALSHAWSTRNREHKEEER